LCADSARSADHGLHLQALGFKANTLKEFNQDVKCCLKEHRVSRRKVGIIHIEDCKKMYQFGKVSLFVVLRGPLRESG
jgi:hypothetical protein